MKKNEQHDRVVTIRITESQHDLINTLAGENRQTVSSMIGGMIDACVEIIRHKGDDPSMPQFLAVCRLSHTYKETPEREKIKT
jgi:hypothetical protein